MALGCEKSRKEGGRSRVEGGRTRLEEVPSGSSYPWSFRHLGVEVPRKGRTRDRRFKTSSGDIPDRLEGWVKGTRVRKEQDMGRPQRRDLLDAHPGRVGSSVGDRGRRSPYEVGGSKRSVTGTEGGGRGRTAPRAVGPGWGYLLGFRMTYIEVHCKDINIVTTFGCTKCVLVGEVGEGRAGVVLQKFGECQGPRPPLSECLTHSRRRH